MIMKMPFPVEKVRIVSGEQLSIEISAISNNEECWMWAVNYQRMRFGIDYSHGQKFYGSITTLG